MPELIRENLAQFAPITNHYRLEDGRHVLITTPHEAGLDRALEQVEVAIPLGLLPALKVASSVRMPTEIFLADADAVPIDADGDPCNGLTPLLRCEPGTTHAQALAALGHDGPIRRAHVDDHAEPIGPELPEETP